MIEPELKVNRRLVPQFSLNNRQEMKVVAPAEVARKTVTRFTREQLIALRKSSDPLPTMKTMAEVYCTDVQEPVCFSKLEPEDVIRIWNAANKDVAGRGRGRPRVHNQRLEDGTTDETFANSSELWDDGTLLGASEGKDFDLTEISKASLQFRSDMQNMKLSEGVDLSSKEVDAMDSLIEEQENERNAESTMLPTDPEPPFTSESPFVTTEEKKPLEAPVLSSPSFGFHIPAKEEKLEQDFSSHSKPAVGPDPMASFLSSLPSANPVTLSDVPATGLSPLFPTMSIFQNESLLQRKVDPEWFYTDPQLQVQGPFTQENMRLWNEAGYFAKDLPIKLRQWNSFYPFKEVFPESRLAFYTIPSEPIHPSRSAIVNQGNLSYLAASSGSSLTTIDGRRIDSLATERTNSRIEIPLAFGSDLFAPTESLPRESTVLAMNKSLATPNSGLTMSPNASVDEKHKEVVNPKVSSSGDNKSQLAKSALGISTKGRTTVGSKAEDAHPVKLSTHSSPQLLPQPEAEKDSNSDQKSKSGWKMNEIAKNKPQSFLDIQQEAVDERKTLKEKIIPPTATSHPTAMSAQLKSILGLKPQQQQQVSTNAAATTTAATARKGAWSSVTADIPSTPLTEIMKEEINQQSQRKDSYSTERQKGSTWASKIVAGSGSLTLSSNQRSLPASSSERAGPKSPGRAQTAAYNSTSTVNNRGQSAWGSTTSMNESDFGGKKMSKELSDWCSAQLKAIKGIEDISLMEFCMSLSSAVEIRETLASNLGSTPQVTNFATEFIKYKDGGRPPFNRQNNAEATPQVISNNQRKKKSSK